MKIRVESNIESFVTKMEHKKKALSKAVDEGLTRWAVMANTKAEHNLSGEGSKYENVSGKYRRRKAAASKGAYPVNVVTGNLKGSQDYIVPGETKYAIGARSGEAYLVNMAVYAHAVHSGKGPHKKFGARPFMKDAIKDTREQGKKATIYALRKVLMGK